MAFRKTGLVLSLVAAGALGATAANAGGAGKSAGTTLMDAAGKSIGQVSIKKEDDGLLVKTTVTGLKPGNYAFHLHTVGKCEAPGFTSAEGHWNPTGKEHGKDNPQGKHMGDLPNIEVTASGSGSLEQKISAATLTKGENALLDADGAAAVLHAGPDDYKTNPSGDSGARIACGVIALSK